MEEAPGGATAPEGFAACGIVCGVRGEGGRDLGLLYSESPCVSVGVYTRNAFEGAPLAVTREAVEAGAVRAVVANSGNANAATGAPGVEDARAMQESAARALGLGAREVAVASTGVIGERLPIERIRESIPEVAGGLSRDGSSFAEAILTTDTRTKEAAVRVPLGGGYVTVGGTAKGSGMIHPNMGTMLAFLTTDAAVDRDCLQETLARTVDFSFNRVTVDGDTSPSDMALLLANGAAGNEPLNADSSEYPAFVEAVEAVTKRLAREIARDGEGATKLVEATVEGARDEEQAAALAKAVVGSSLVKAAVAGEDANWGRVLVALGYSGAEFDPAGLTLYFGGVKVFEAGEPVAHDEKAANRALAGDEVEIRAVVGSRGASATAWGCDLTYEYVRINGSYRT
ncbi:bifunctional glutamate N-acetyltransferase/amino-acid acetyltransferase ArgJ [Rubrobacter aplysinae]|uniref:bifunctional glutamate N-acetyltransferase/amino-acid acetyltransferase ArgJ n=1 Tax=Rubrobacter aplysinae TaxID=909625 RepID=UPI00064BF65A|nr:bifunctional glutamate N-acetyltransferase/amino-acid acetyltransferase ArgJ [Rubrobacter aplysinae]